MKRTLLVTLLAIAVLLTSSRAQQPTFRSSVDFVELDVFVTDGRGAFVKDLTAADFELFEDNAPQKIDTFEHVVVQPAGPQETLTEPTSVRMVPGARAGAIQRATSA